jgi:rhodanese-related sulfurtransferase
MFWKRSSAVAEITPEELAQAMGGSRPPVVVDVRGPQAFRAGHLPGAVNIPLDELGRRAAELDPTAPAVFY